MPVVTEAQVRAACPADLGPWSERLPDLIEAAEAAVVTFTQRTWDTAPPDVREAVIDTVVRWVGAHPPADRPDDELGTGFVHDGALSYRARQLLQPHRYRTVT